jgi:hypothetical protein
MRNASRIVVAALAGVFFVTSAQPLPAQESSRSVSTASKFYVDQKTGQVFVRPGKGRVPLVIGPSIDQRVIEQKVEQQTHDQVRAAIATTQARQQIEMADLQKQIAEIKPAWKSYLDNFQNKFRLGALAYLDYAMYTHTGFGPRFLENLNPPGPGNNGFNSFDINRVYLNAYFTPVDDWTFRFTPEIFRATGAQSNSSTNDRFGATSAVASNLDGNLNLRLKFAYAQYSGLWNDVPALKGGTVTIGAQQNPLLGWEEDFSSYRWVYLAPWNYLGLSSSQIGLQFAGPVRFFGSDKTVLDYAAAVFDNGNFSTPEQSNTKQMMGRLTAYPFGSSFRFQGLGLTGFWNYGWGDTTPDNQGLVSPLKGNRAQFQRIAATVSYAAEQWNILGEFDYGKNAFQLGNLFSATGPLDAFGTATGTAVTKSGAFGNTGKDGTKACSSTTLCYNVFGTYGPQTAVYQAILNNGRADQLGVDFLGHYHIPGTKLTAFGLFQWLMPNDNVRGANPLDFQRVIAGVSYQYNEYLRFALDSQNILFYHSQESMPIASAASYNYIPGGTFNGRLLPARQTKAKTPFAYDGTIPFLVPRDTHAIFLNMEFSY